MGADVAAASRVSLREVTADTVRDVCRLDVAPGQRSLVAPNAISIAQAYFEPAAWFRAVYAGDTPVGFAMLYDPTRAVRPENGADVCFLWRFMIDHRYQRNGHGVAALRLLIEHVRALPGVTRFRTSFVDQPGNAAPVYERVGFRRTGEIDDGELVMELRIDSGFA